MYFLKLVNGLESPINAQKLISFIPYNFNYEGRILSPYYALKKNKIVCFEAALLAAAFTSLTQPPLVLCMSSENSTVGYAVFLFKENGKLGAVGKNRNPKNEWREPVFSSINELVESYGYTNYQFMDWSLVPDWKQTNKNMNEYLWMWPEISIYDSIKKVY